MIAQRGIISSHQSTGSAHVAVKALVTSDHCGFTKNIIRHTSCQIRAMKPNATLNTHDVLYGQLKQISIENKWTNAGSQYKKYKATGSLVATTKNLA